METTRIEKRIGVRAGTEQIWEVLTDLSNWSRWNPYESILDGQLSFNGQLVVQERLPDLGSRESAVRLGDWQPESKLIWSEKRGFLFASTRYFHIQQLEKNSCILSHGILFSGLRGEMFHDKHRAKIRTAYDEIAENLKQLVEA